MAQRFTMDGSATLEARLQAMCRRVSERVQEIVPPRKLDAIVLGGGYGRGQGGVLRVGFADAPYNDLEFYVFTRGNRILDIQRYSEPLNRMGEALSPEAGLHVEFKVETSDRLRSSPVSMFSYDLVTAHQIVFGSEEIFKGCEHHRDATAIPVSEATRLLFNRCTGLLLAKEKLAMSPATPGEADFIARNIAKAQLALGDAWLTAHGQYHWSCLERHDRLNAFQGPPELVRRIIPHHFAGVTFKLHPMRSHETFDTLGTLHDEITQLAREMWLLIEGKRFNRTFASPEEYAVCDAPKCNGTPAWMNYALNVRSFGWRALLDPFASRYPRERLLNALPLLLWAPADRADSLRDLLHAEGSDWNALVSAYKQIWPSYG